VVEEGVIDIEEIDEEADKEEEDRKM